MTETQDQAFERRLREGYERQRVQAVHWRQIGEASETIAALESQNQALQERLTKTWWNKREHELEDELAALQEALRWIAANEVDPLDGNRVVQLQAMIDRARNALSPTQETDPG